MTKRKGFGKGRSPSKFSFTYEDYSVLSGMTIEAVRKHAQRGNFNPRDLMSVLEFVQRNGPEADEDGQSVPISEYPVPIAKFKRKK